MTSQPFGLQSQSQPPVDDVHEAINLIQRHMKAVRFTPDSSLDQAITRLAREVQEWEQDAFAQQTAGSGRWA